VVTQAGRKRAKVSAAHFQRYERDEKALLDGGVEVHFYNARGTERVSTLTAQRAEIDDRSRNMTASGGVVLAAQDSTRLETDALCWHRESEKITGEGRVTIYRPDGMESGVGFEASSDLKRWSMRQVTTRLGDPDSTQH
jgi:LPS export ABC transporter protein LptC